jgi:hypothetical protein
MGLLYLFIYQPLFKAYKNAQRDIVTRSHNRCYSGKVKMSSLCIVEVNMWDISGYHADFLMKDTALSRNGRVAARHGMGTALARHDVCEFAFV